MRVCCRICSASLIIFHCSIRIVSNRRKIKNNSLNIANASLFDVENCSKWNMEFYTDTECWRSNQTNLLLFLPLSRSMCAPHTVGLCIIRMSILLLNEFDPSNYQHSFDANGLFFFFVSSVFEFFSFKQKHYRCICKCSRNVRSCRSAISQRCTCKTFTRAGDVVVAFVVFKFVLFFVHCWSFAPCLSYIREISAMKGQWYCSSCCVCSKRVGVGCFIILMHLPTLCVRNNFFSLNFLFGVCVWFDSISKSFCFGFLLFFKFVCILLLTIYWSILPTKNDCNNKFDKRYIYMYKVYGYASFCSAKAAKRPLNLFHCVALFFF